MKLKAACMEQGLTAYMIRYRIYEILRVLKEKDIHARSGE